MQLLIPLMIPLMDGDGFNSKWKGLEWRCGDGVAEGVGGACLV
jgi:hypothetical protein